MRTAAIATISKDFLLTNYGSFFQHYALRKVLTACGFRPFRVLDEDELRPKSERLWEWIKDRMRPLYWAITGLPNRKRHSLRLKMRHRSFRIFKRDYERVIGRIDERQLFDDSTVGIRGGDQVLTQDSDRRWFKAIKGGNPCITYAVSTDWVENGGRDCWRRDVSVRLQRMNAVGLREEKGVSILRALLSQDIPVRRVADPVQLLTADDFRNIQSQCTFFRRPTLLCYLLNIRSSDDLSLAKYESLAALLGCDLKIVGIQGAELYVPKDKLLVLSPLQFLNTLDEAEYFVTNSYHGSLLALLYHKRFISVRQNCLPGTNQNERQQELMTSLGLKDFWMDSATTALKMFNQIIVPIDWRAVDSQQEEFRVDSVRWLQDVLG